MSWKYQKPVDKPIPLPLKICSYVIIGIGVVLCGMCLAVMFGA